MITKSAVKTLQLTFADGQGKELRFQLAKPKSDLSAAVVDTAAKAVIDSGIFATENGALTVLKDRQIVTRMIETFEGA